MKYVTYLYDNKESVGFLNESDNAVYPLPFADMNALIEAPKEKLEVVIKEAKNKILLSDVTLLAPIPRPKQDVICLGINYKAHAIEELSSGMTLMPGTIIATGTPSGVGMGFDPPKFLKSGDMVECSIEGIGTLRNVVRQARIILKSMKKRNIVYYLLLILIMAVLTGCGYTQEEKAEMKRYEKQGRENAENYIKAKYGIDAKVREFLNFR